ncbi:WD repeat-containing protein 61 [Eumeta japonica]|uniref:WD repeat-containing protein 61 n=1 Tax=Eumeta variegata TaxID=151549 RepID=A0A4C1VYA1_EUMVA|nr:WD repeat-containing protein 61 [Eumeta japonica]
MFCTCWLKAIVASSRPVNVKPLIKSLIFGKIKKSHGASELSTDYIVTGGLDSVIKVWKFEKDKLELVHTLKEHFMGIVSVALSPDAHSNFPDIPGQGNLLLALRNALGSHLVDAISGDDLSGTSSNKVDHTSWVLSASYSPDGKRIVSASADNSVRVWDSKIKKCVNVFQEHCDEGWLPTRELLTSEQRKYEILHMYLGNVIARSSCYGYCTQVPALDLSILFIEIKEQVRQQEEQVCRLEEQAREQALDLACRMMSRFDFKVQVEWKQDINDVYDGLHSHSMKIESLVQAACLSLRKGVSAGM